MSNRTKFLLSVLCLLNFSMFVGYLSTWIGFILSVIIGAGGGIFIGIFMGNYGFEWYMDNH